MMLLKKRDFKDPKVPNLYMLASSLSPNDPTFVLLSLDFAGPT